MAISNRFSHPSSPPTEDQKDYWRVFRKRCFQLLKWGYDRLDAVQYQASEEEIITGDLVQQIDAIIQDRRYPEWVARFSVHEEKPIFAAGRKGKKRQRLDIELEWVRSGKRPRYPFEAKRLCANTHATMGAYLGEEGMGEFLGGHYAPGLDEAGMLGYLQSDTPTIWSQKARNQLRKNPNKFYLLENGGWSKTAILGDSDICFRSVHRRILSGKPITLYHLFLMFC